MNTTRHMMVVSILAVGFVVATTYFAYCDGPSGGINYGAPEGRVIRMAQGRHSNTSAGNRGNLGWGGVQSHIQQQKAPPGSANPSAHSTSGDRHSINYSKNMPPGSFECPAAQCPKGYHPGKGLKGGNMVDIAIPDPPPKKRTDDQTGSKRKGNSQRTGPNQGNYYVPNSNQNLNDTVYQNGQAVSTYKSYH
jgi:hypothetical protein